MLLYRTLIDRVTREIIVGLAIFALLMFSLPPAAQAQEPPNRPDSTIPRVYLPFVGTEGLQSAPPAEASVFDPGLHQPPSSSTPLKLLVDTDMGVDDAVALTWLVSQDDFPMQLLGVVTVAGNTSVENATTNVLNVMARLQLSHTEIVTVPVVMGAAKPQKQKLSKTSWLIHGPDGLWFQGFSNPLNLTNLPKKADAFYCNTVALNPGATLLALGPLTNVADAYKKCPNVMATLSRVVVLGGAKFGGNKTSVAEFNYWQDPEAADYVFSPPARLPRLPIDLVPLDTFGLPTLSQFDAMTLFASTNPATNFLAVPLLTYVTVQISNTQPATIPDAVAAVYAVNPTIGIRETALVKMVLESGQARGQSVIGLTIPERVAMIADDEELSRLAERAFPPPYYYPDSNFNLQAELFAILQREPDNVVVLTSVSSDLLTDLVLPDLQQ